ncbi:hypothetical protein DBQ04_00365 [Lactobacillus acidophilus]|uniref:Uncharacterized protein n=1 Tax=Lactobacillus acidophilus (strain ATCC 700396 / NCK56 / N2 / NCFM) TaxID=272621 RepID=Q5FJR8_LACAC|nr:hypothetical protein LBA1221 [Lactobacillus acidophilus NCFM]AZN76430.1 hypothetical protein CXB72_04435 [Lactobacillus acidophilus]CDF73314.1 Putative uncharacterized protein [Lactobacillus acidophilus DSM 9126]MCT3593301.1 hypothetical protein [Lactobacillus acidophilus]MCT3601543.1 hypothetical protein [Lactobacillus acidophilus]
MRVTTFFYIIIANNALRVHEKIRYVGAVTGTPD